MEKQKKQNRSACIRWRSRIQIGNIGREEREGVKLVGGGADDDERQERMDSCSQAVQHGGTERSLLLLASNIICL